MHIVLIEKEWMEEEFLAKELKDAFPDDTITTFGNLEHFLLVRENLPKIDLIITEIFFSLMGHPTEDFDERRKRLGNLFPEVVEGWHHSKAAKKLLEYLRKIDLKVNVIVYTHSDQPVFNSELGEYPNVIYQQKEPLLDNLIDCIQNFSWKQI